MKLLNSKSEPSCSSRKSRSYQPRKGIIINDPPPFLKKKTHIEPKPPKETGTTAHDKLEIKHSSKINPRRSTKVISKSGMHSPLLMLPNPSKNDFEGSLILNKNERDDMSKKSKKSKKSSKSHKRNKKHKQSKIFVSQNYFHKIYNEMKEDTESRYLNYMKECEDI